MCWDFRRGPVVKNLPSSARDAGLFPGQGSKIPHAAAELSPRATATEPTCSGACTPQLESLCATTTEPMHSGAHVPQLERSPCVATREDPACRN